MFMKALVNECDFTGTKYDSPVEGAWCLAQGATGRYCCVMYAGPEFLASNSYTLLTREEAEAQVEKEEGAWVDF